MCVLVSEPPSVTSVFSTMNLWNGVSYARHTYTDSSVANMSARSLSPDACHRLSSVESLWTHVLGAQTSCVHRRLLLYGANLLLNKGQPLVVPTAANCTCSHGWPAVYAIQCGRPPALHGTDACQCNTCVGHAIETATMVASWRSLCVDAIGAAIAHSTQVVIYSC